MNEWSPLMMAAQSNFRSHLGQNPYPGRGIVIGLDETGEYLVQVYWIMGRSPNSRNRLFEEDGTGRVYTVPADPAKVQDPSLIIYNAMMSDRDIHVVSNGNQTDTVVEQLGWNNDSRTLDEVMYEPDEPNFTSRITGTSGWEGDNKKPAGAIWIVRKSMWGVLSDHLIHQFSTFGRGYGHCVTTYKGDGDPLPPFRGEPLLMPLRGNAEEIADAYWAALDRDNKISLAVKFIAKDNATQVHLINKLTKVA